MEWESYLRFVLALIAVLGLLGLLTWAMKRFGLNRGLGPARGRRGGRRLAITEALPVDTRRKLLLIRRDDSEHLILIGGPQDLLVESGIAIAEANDEAPMGQAPVGVPVGVTEPAGVLRLLRGEAGAASGAGTSGGNGTANGSGGAT